MADQWDRFADSSTRTTGALGFENNVEVYEPTEQYTDEWDVSYPDSPTNTIAAETTPPESDSNVDTGGTTQTADMHIYVPTGVGVSWTDTGQSGQAVTRIRVVPTDTWYEVETVDSMFDGTERLQCAEVDV